MINDIKNILASFENDIKEINNINEFTYISSFYLGKNGKLNDIFLKIKSYNIINKIELLKEFNITKKLMINLLNIKKSNIKTYIKDYDIDITIPLYNDEIGSTHIINNEIKHICHFFENNKFIIENGIEIDNNYYNFDALNMPIDHPSRSLSDTFFINDFFLLRTHTSNMQIHVIENSIPPIKTLSCGKVYRRDYDISHTPMFHQIEGFIIDTHISLSTLKTILNDFLNSYFNNEISMKFRSSYFPFTEPSFEVDIKCVHCINGCQVCKNSGWIEILGCGMINPFILNTNNISSKIYAGLAFGMGVERLTMVKYKINNIKFFYENSLDFLRQF